MVKVCALHAPKPYIVKCPPQGLMSIAAYLKGNGVRTDILDANIHYADLPSIKRASYEKLLKRKSFSRIFDAVKQDFPEKQLAGFFRKNSFDIVLLDCQFSGTANYSFRTCELIKKVSPGTIVVTGGMHATIFHKELLEQYPFDVVIRGEGEEIALELARRIEGGLRGPEGTGTAETCAAGESSPGPGKTGSIDLTGIRGITYRNGNETAVNPGSGLVMDMDTLFPVYDVYEEFEMDRYREYVQAVLGPFWRDQDPAGVILTSRGCIGRCTFCNGRTIDQGRYRSFSKEYIIRQLTHIYNRYRPGKFGFYDAMFGGNTDTYKAVCDFFRARDVEWGFETRIDVMTEDKLNYVKNTHCKYILYGLESVNTEVLKFNKKIPKTVKDDYMDKAARLFKKTRDMKIICCITVLYGLPGEDNGIFRETIDFFVKNDLRNSYYLEYYFCAPIMYPGTDLWYSAAPEDRCYDWDKFFVVNENIIEEGKIVYKNPDIDMDKLKYYVDNSERIINRQDGPEKLTHRISARSRTIKRIFAEARKGIGSFLDFKWFMLSLWYTLIRA